MADTNNFEVIIVGGSYSGLSAGMVLGRSLQHVLIVDSGKPCNLQTPHSHSFLTRDGETPVAMSAVARRQVLSYPTVAFQQDKAISVQKQDGVFRVSTEMGAEFFARVLVLATGVSDQMPDIRGFAACWGISVLHCPFCHGYEVRHQNIGLLGNGDTGFELTRLIYNWSTKLTLFTNGESELSQEQSVVLRQHGIAIVESPVMEIDHERGYIRNLITANGARFPLDAMFARAPFVQHSDLAQQLGCAHAETGLTVVDDFGRTNIEGVYAAGDTCSFMRQVVFASASGTKAGVSIIKALVVEAF